jgi:hypothetical protein
MERAKDTEDAANLQSSLGDSTNAVAEHLDPHKRAALPVKRAPGSNDRGTESCMGIFFNYETLNRRMEGSSPESRVNSTGLIFGHAAAQ